MSNIIPFPKKKKTIRLVFLDDFSVVDPLVEQATKELVRALQKRSADFEKTIDCMNPTKKG